MEDALYHISDQPGITRFDPRPAPHPRPGLPDSMVWAIDREGLRNFMLPRQCPRVTFYAMPESDPADIERLMGWSTAKYIIAVESGWMPEIQRCCLYQYEFPPETFQMIEDDGGSGYYISKESVVPRSVTKIENLLDALLSYDVELRVMPSLWKLREQVIPSSLQFSIIRFRNARPPEEGVEAYYPL